MSVAVEMNVIGCTDAEEEECIARLYPWKCRTDNLAVYQEYRTLEEMAAVQAIGVDTILDAIKHHGGHLGAFHFMQR